MPQHKEQHDEHSVSYTRYIVIWLGLLAFTGFTVALAGIDLGRWVIITSLAIAAVKSLLVLNIFMHLKFEDKVFKIFVLVAVATLAVFIGLTFFDYAFY